MDVVGELPVPCGEGERYILTVVDDHSRHVEARSLSRKSDVPAAVKEIVNFWETQHRMPVKAIRTDRGGEFVNAKLHHFSQKKESDMKCLLLTLLNRTLRLKE